MNDTANCNIFINDFTISTEYILLSVRLFAVHVDSVQSKVDLCTTADPYNAEKMQVDEPETLKKNQYSVNIKV